MKGTIPIITCDSEVGCPEWMIDNYEMGVSNWGVFVDGWNYSPYRDNAYCPEHHAEGVA